MSTRPISTCAMRNGLNLECLDQSRKIAADRWYVCVWVHIAIPVEKKCFARHPIDENKFRQIRRVLGQEVIFKQKNERNFVSDDQKTRMVQEICDRAAQMAKTYFAHEDFAAKSILKFYKDRLHRR
jgi:hypothetical protein